MKYDNHSYKNIGRDRIIEIFQQGWNQIEFIEAVFREWVKLNQIVLNNEYAKQKSVKRKDGDIDVFSLWLVDNIYLDIYCKGTDNSIVKDICLKNFGDNISENLEDELE